MYLQMLSKAGWMVILGMLVTAGCAPGNIGWDRHSRRQLRAADIYGMSHVTPSSEKVVQAAYSQAAAQDVLSGQPGILSRQGPAVSGRRLGLFPGETATERALALEKQLADAKVENQKLSQQVSMLGQKIEMKNQHLRRATHEIANVRTELVEVRNELQAWTTEVDEIQKRIQSAEDDNRETLEFIIDKLQVLTNSGGIPPGGRKPTE